MNPKVFLSHRHDDKIIADVINSHLRKWNIPANDIHQSSAPRQGGRPGSNLNEELKSAIFDTNLFVLIYTTADEDWSYCMWECGVATDPTSEITRIVVFQCTDQVPRVYQDHIRVIITPEKILDFTEQLHKGIGFVPPPRSEPSHSAAVFPDIDDETIQLRSHELFRDLDNVIPKGRFEEQHRWDYLLLRLNPLAVRTVRDTKDHDEAIRIISSETEIKPGNRDAAYVGTALRQFGFQSYEDGLTLPDIIDRWSEEDQNRIEEQYRNSSMAWLDDLHNDILRAVKNRDAIPTFNYFKSIRQDTNWWFRPAVTRARKFPDDAMEFDVYLYRVESPPESGDAALQADVE